MNIEELAVTLTMMGYKPNMNYNKTAISLFGINSKKEEEIKNILRTLNFYFAFSKLGICMISKENNFKWN